MTELNMLPTCLDKNLLSRIFMVILICGSADGMRRRSEVPDGYKTAEVEIGCAKPCPAGLGIVPQLTRYHQSRVFRACTDRSAGDDVSGIYH
jgi:hypothetical protein